MLWHGTTRNQDSRGIRPRSVNRIHQAQGEPEGHLWPGCRPVNDTWHPYSYEQTKQKRGLNNVGQVNPKDCYLSRKDSGDIQVVKPCKCGWWRPASLFTNIWMDTPLDHAQDEAMPLVEWSLTPMGHCNLEEEYANVITSTNHLEILCFVTGPPLARLPKPTKAVLTFCTRQNAQCIFLGPVSRGSAMGLL